MLSLSKNGSAPPVAPFAERFQKLKEGLHRQLVEMLDLSRVDTVPPERLKREIRALAQELTVGTTELLGEADRERLVEELEAEVFGLGPLEPLMRDRTISDILVNGPRQVYIERNGRLLQTDIVFANDEHVMRIIQRIAARVGRRADEMSPMVDARLPDGSRVNAIVPPLSLEGPVAVDPPVWRAPAKRGPAGQRDDAAGDPRLAAGGGRGSHQHARGRRDRERQNDLAQSPVPLSSPPTSAW